MQNERFIKRLLIDITTKCNLFCIMCGVPHQKDKYDMPPDLYTKIASQAFIHTEEIWFSCGYEAFMSRYFLDILEFTKKFSIPKSSIITNGTLLNERNIIKIVESGLSRLIISIDGATKFTYEKIRKGANFELLISNIDKLNRIKSELSSDAPELIFTVTLMQSNIKEFPKIILLASKLGVKEVWCKPIQAIPPALEQEILTNNKDMVVQIFNEAKDIARRLKIEIGSSPDMAKYIINDNEPTNKQDNSIIKCRENPFPIIFISPDGKVKPCTMWRQAPIGDFKLQNFNDIWNQQEYRKLREEVARGNLRESCKKCLYANNAIT
jgi:radical SAM protein with 4Fe4S-binding SPASM domain